MFSCEVCKAAGGGNTSQASSFGQKSQQLAKNFTNFPDNSLFVESVWYKCDGGPFAVLFVESVAYSTVAGGRQGRVDTGQRDYHGPAPLN